MSFYRIKVGEEAVWGARFGKNLEYIIRSRKIKISDIAKKMGVNNTMIYAYMRGSTIPNYFKMCKLAEAVGCDFKELVEFEDNNDDDIDDYEDFI